MQCFAKNCMKFGVYCLDMIDELSQHHGHLINHYHCICFRNVWPLWCHFLSVLFVALFSRQWHLVVHHLVICHYNIPMLLLCYSHNIHQLIICICQSLCQHSWIIARGPIYCLSACSCNHELQKAYSWYWHSFPPHPQHRIYLYDPLMCFPYILFTMNISNSWRFIMFFMKVNSAVDFSLTNITLYVFMPCWQIWSSNLNAL